MPVRKPILAISMGDPAGVGPEITVKALRDDDVWARCTPVVCGNAEALSEISRVVKSPLPVTVVSESAEFFESLSEPSGQVNRKKEVLVVECGLPKIPVPFGKVSREGGEASYKYIMKAIDLAGLSPALSTRRPSTWPECRIPVTLRCSPPGPVSRSTP